MITSKMNKAKLPTHIELSSSEYDMDKDLEVFREDLKRLMAIEITTRYYYQRGGLYHSLKDDKCLDLAIGILDNPEAYKNILQVLKD